MSKLNNLSGGYKGGSNKFIPQKDPKKNKPLDKNSDIEQYLKFLKDEYYDNNISKNDLIFYKKCMEDFINNINPTTNFSSILNKKLQDLVAFTKLGVELNKINESHLQQKIDGIDNIIKTINPKTIDVKPPSKIDGKINSLSSGYKTK